MRDIQVMGHRGARFEAPENTTAGFRYALSMDLSAVELDVRLTADGELVVIHDDSVDRTTNGHGRIADLTLDELRTLDARSNFLEQEEPCGIPTLAEALETLSGLEVIEIEIKRDADERIRELVPKVVHEIAARGLEERVILTSFEPFALRIADEHAPELRRCYIGNWDNPEFLGTAQELGCTRVGVRHATANRDIVEEAQRQGMEVVCWPVNSPEELDNALRFNPDVICTDNPTLIRDLLIEREVPIR